MTDERWKLAYAIYQAAASLAELGRQQYVHATAPDAEIAGKVLAMLAETETIADSDAFPKPTNSTNPAAAPPFNLPYGAALGRFVITGFVGQGGMGMVYSAHDPDLKREP